MARSIRDPQSRNRIVQAAWRLVASGGIRSTTMRAIAAEAGVTTGSVTHYFEDKEEVMTAVLEYNNLVVQRRVLESTRGLRGLEAVRKYVLVVIPAGTEGMTVWRVWLTFWTENDARDLDSRQMQSGWDNWRKGLRARLREAVADGELPDNLDLRYESDRIGTLVAGVGLVFGATQHSRRQISARASRMLDDYLASLTDQGSVRA